MWRVGALAVVLALGAPTVSAAQAPPGDSVTGTAATGAGRQYVEFTFDAHSGPLGERPTGTVRLNALVGDLGALPLSCLSVDGNRASMIVKAPENSSSIAGLAISVEDNQAGQDKIDWQTLMTLPSDCPVASVVYDPTVSGDVTVSDAPPPPTTYSQCRQAGWVKYGFNSRAACISYVHELARQKCIFERAAHGITAFRLKYGLGPHHKHAMRRCVRLYTGF
jgi:hypothetical protein